MGAHRNRRRKRARKEEEKPEKVVTVEAKSTHNIPNDIMYDILLRLPAKSLLRFKAVCKSWRALLSDPRFKKSHLKLANKCCDIVSYCQFSEHHERPQTVSLTSINRDALETETVKILYPFMYSPVRGVKILGSCDGLLLIGISSKTLLWNPTTRECNRLATNGWDLSGNVYGYISGLGYSSSIDEYKAVLFANDRHRRSNMYLCSTSRSTRCNGGWKKVDGVHDFPYTIITYDDGSGITVNGVPHWVVVFPREEHASKYRTIIYFDMVEEKFKRLPTPTSWSNSRQSIDTVAVLGGCLCTSIYNSRNDCYDVWVMKEYGVKESYTKLFAIRMPGAGRLMPLGFTKNGDEVVLHLSWKGLVAYDLNTRNEKFILSTTKESGGSVLLVESLISPGRSNEEKKHTVE